MGLLVIVNAVVWVIKQHPLYGLIICLYSVQKHLTPCQKENRDKQCKKKKKK